MSRVRPALLAVALLLPFSQASAALSVDGNIEYLFTSLSTRDTPLNPGNVLSVPDYSHLLELRLNASFGRFYGEWRGRYESWPEGYSSHFDQAYLSFEESEPLKLRVGRQRIGFGVGYAWNPVNDLDKRRDIYNPTKYVEGVNAAKSTFDFSDRYGRPMQLSFAVVIPDGTGSAPDLRYSRLGSQFYVLTHDVELGLTASYGKNEGAGGGENLLFGAYSSADIGGAILELEYAVSRKPYLPRFSRETAFYRNDFNCQALLNLHRRITEKSFLMLEYFFNGFGYGSGEFDDMLSLLSSSYGEYAPLVAGSLSPGYVSRHYFFGTLSQEMSDHWTLALTTMANLERPGAFLYPQLSYTGVDDITVSLEAITNITGGTENEFSMSVYRHALLVRLQYYF